MRKQYCPGFGLSELLISLFLASFIFISLLNYYFNTKKQYHLTRDRLEQSFEVQSVIELIRDSIRRAGFTPCLAVNYLKTFDTRTQHKNLLALEIAGDGHSSLKVNHMCEYFNTVPSVLSPTRLLVSNFVKMNRGQVVMIADCYHGEVQEISDVKQIANGQIVTLKKPLTYSYVEEIYLGEWLEETFSIQTHAQNKPTLYYQLHHRDELSSYINAMSVQFSKQKKGSLLQIILGLNNEQKIQFDTKVRI